MHIDARFYLHDSDRAALTALKAIPGFTPLLRAFMKHFNEKQFYLQNMSTNLLLGETQLPQYYHMLPPICEKLGIEVPELYLSLDGTPNAYTFGDTKPFIVITSGLLEKMPPDTIPAVLAHECGHIACQHSLYRSMGQIILNEAVDILSIWGLAELAAIPLQIALSYWMRCSELSADRAAVLCCGESAPMINTCMAFTGLCKSIQGQTDVGAFLAQAEKYREMLQDNKWDKTTEFLHNAYRSHPLNAVRALECKEWAESEDFQKLMHYMSLPEREEGHQLSEYTSELPMVESSKFYAGKDPEEVVAELKNLGFDNVTSIRTTLKKGNVKPGNVTTILFNDHDGFTGHQWLPIDADIQVEYYLPPTEEEIAAAHPGQRRVPNTCKGFQSMTFLQAKAELEKAGFTNIRPQCINKGKKGFFDKQHGVVRVAISEQTQYEKGEWFPEDADICITFHNYMM